MSTEKLIIFDTTMRDGEQSPGASMTRDEKLRIARQLERMRVDVIEAGFPASSNGDFEAVSAIAKVIKDSTVAGLCRANDKDIQRGILSINELVSIAVLAAFASGDYKTAGVVAFFMLMGEIIETRTAEGARASIESLIKLTPTKARRLKMLHGIKVVFVDYLQLMYDRASKENRQQEISAISRGLKALARKAMHLDPDFERLTYGDDGDRRGRGRRPCSSRRRHGPRSRARWSSRCATCSRTRCVSLAARSASRTR